LIQSVRISRLDAKLSALKALFGALVNLIEVKLEGKISSAALDRRACLLGRRVVGVFELYSVVIAFLSITVTIAGNGILIELCPVKDNNLCVGVYALNILEALFLLSLSTTKSTVKTRLSLLGVVSL